MFSTVKGFTTNVLVCGIKKNRFIYFFVSEYFACVYFHAHIALRRPRTALDPRNWNYGWSWTTLSMLRPEQEQPAELITEPYLQPRVCRIFDLKVLWHFFSFQSTIIFWFSPPDSFCFILFFSVCSFVLCLCVGTWVPGHVIAMTCM
jgi:hypothetical protein